MAHRQRDALDAAAIVKAQQLLVDFAVFSGLALFVEAARQLQPGSLPPHRRCARPSAELFWLEHAITDGLPMDPAGEPLALLVAEPQLRLGFKLPCRRSQKVELLGWWGRHANRRAP